MKTLIKTEQKNGTAHSNTPDVKAIIPVPEKQEAKKAQSGVSDIEARIMKVEELRSLTTKRQKTVTTLHELKSFQFAADDSCFITIADSQNRKFQTGNSNLVTLLRNYLEAVLNDKISALDDEILAFTI